MATSATTNTDSTISDASGASPALDMEKLQSLLGKLILESGATMHSGLVASAPAKPVSTNASVSR